VDVALVIHGSGLLKDVRITPDRPESSLFATALETLIPDWRGYPAVSDCFPVAEPAQLRVTFNPSAQKPVSLRWTDGKVRSRTAALPGQLKPVLQMHPSYPPFTHIEEDVLVYTKQEIDEWGKVVKVWATAYRTTGGSQDKGLARKLVGEESLDETLRKFMHNASLVAYRWVFPNFSRDGHRFTCNRFLFTPPK